jgi:hypothetical protein
MKYLKLSVILALSYIIGACNFLNVDDYFEENFKYDSIFATVHNIERYLWTVAATFPDECNFFIGGAPNSFATDEAFSGHPNDYPALNYTRGLVTPTNAAGTSIWASMYGIIRRANTIISNIDKPHDMTALDRRDLLGYAYFMRAYAYYKLFMQYGPLVILYDDVLDTNADVDYYDRARETFDDTVDYICQQFELAASMMPNVVSVSFFGRPTRDAALGLAARLRLIQASPLWNGGEAARRTYGAWRRSTDNVHYVSQTYDENKWAVAAFAAKRVIETGMYSLHTVPKFPDTPDLPANVSAADFPFGAGNIDPFMSYSDMFTGEAMMTRNPEYIWARQSASLLSFTRHSFPVTRMNGWGTISIPQKVVDAYLMADGRPIGNSSTEYPYLTTGFIGGSNKTFSGYTLDANAHNMYNNREMRFYASIGFSRAIWNCNSFSETSFQNTRFEYYSNPSGLGSTTDAGKSSSPTYVNNVNVTGYSLKKYVHPDDAWGSAFDGLDALGARRIAKAYPIIRYAEILLSYVEALNNITSPQTVVDAQGDSHTFTRDVAEMALYFNMVRVRAGLPGLTAAELASRETMQALIERERLVEFLCENLRYFDVRRWGIYEQTENEPIMGMDVDAPRNGGYYTIVPVNHVHARTRVVDRRMILFPLELVEVRKSPSMDQNPGWQD